MEWFPQHSGCCRPHPGQRHHCDPSGTHIPGTGTRSFIYSVPLSKVGNVAAMESNRQVITVTALTRLARRKLETDFPTVFVEGEISNLVTPRSGHWYFTLKDESAQLRCAMFRNRNQFMRFKPRDGMAVIVRGRVTLYEGRGEFQLIAEFIEETGDGALRRAWERLRDRLQVEGLFDEHHKQSLPLVPGHVGVLTSPSGAAIRDVLAVFGRRFPAARISVLPVQVQGEFAEHQLVRALAWANRSATEQQFDVLLVTRGGGSLEDFAAFNSERVARAIADSTIPVVCAIGHESDTCIAEFASDLRASTPSAAAELISPDTSEWLATFERLEIRLLDIVRRGVERRLLALNALVRQLRHPRTSLEANHQRLDGLEARLHTAIRGRTSQAALKLDGAAWRVRPPVQRVKAQRQNVAQLQARLLRGQMQHLTSAGARFEAAVQRLNALSPLATLERGYAIVSREGTVLQNADTVQVGDIVEARLRRGKLKANVTEVLPDA